MFWTRLFSGIILVLIALFTIITGGEVLLVTSAVVSMIGFWELTAATGVKEKEEKRNILEFAGLFLVFLYYVLLYLAGRMEIQETVFMMFMLILVFFTFTFLYVFSFPRFRSEQIMAAFFDFLYAPVMLSFIYMTRMLPLGRYIVWLTFFCSWGCDTCAYCVGMLFGKHKMSPHLSPKKSIEGAVGGILGAAACGAFYAYFFVDKMLAGQNLVLPFIIICAVGALISMIGDLTASAIKRNHEIKDYGKLIPGHGGIMDRFDSVIFTAPIIYFLVLAMIRF